MSQATIEKPVENKPAAQPAPAKVVPVRKPIFRSRVGAILLGIVVVAAATGIIYWLIARQWEETDDAFIDGNIIPIGTKVAGSISAIHVDDNQMVKAGDVLAEIDPRDTQAKLGQARASLEAARADADEAKTNVELMRANTAAMLMQAQAGVESARAAVETSQAQLASAESDVTVAQTELTHRQADEKRFTSMDPRGVSQAQLDASRAASEVAAAQLVAANKRVIAAKAGVSEATAKVSAAQGVLAAAKTAEQQIAAAEAKSRYAAAQVGVEQAKLEAATLENSYTMIKAPVTGRVTRKNIQEGQYVELGQTLMSVVPEDFWVTANFKETQLARMRVGQPVNISVDAFPGHEFHGKIDSIQMGTGARFSLLPPENATGNYVKVVQRVPVKIVFDRDDSAKELLGVGMSVVPEVHVSVEPSASTRP